VELPVPTIEYNLFKSADISEACRKSAVPVVWAQPQQIQRPVADPSGHWTLKIIVIYEEISDPWDETHLCGKRACQTVVCEGQPGQPRQVPNAWRNCQQEPEYAILRHQTELERTCGKMI
jgi:hypothetical protein